jgi:hypothetical protein
LPQDGYSGALTVFFYKEDGCAQFNCNIAIAGRKPVVIKADTTEEAFEEAFERAVFKTEGLRLCAN